MTTKATEKQIAATNGIAATFDDPDDPRRATAMAIFATDPNTGAAAVIGCHGKTLGHGHGELNALAEQLDAGTDEVIAGDMRRAETMLFAQASALHAIFVELGARSTRQDQMPHWEAYLRMALKAQNQCRMTLETLSTIKNPPVVFARQANLNLGGQQQVNNGAVPAASAPARAAKPAKPPTELLEKSNGQRLDTGTPSTTGRADSRLAPVGEVDRTQDRKRKVPVGAKPRSRLDAADTSGARKGAAGRA